MSRWVASFVVAIVLGTAPAAWADDGGDDAMDKDKNSSRAGTLYAEAGVVFNLLHIPESTADGGFGFRLAAGFQFTDKVRAHFAFRTLSNENKDTGGTKEDYSDLSLGLALSLDGKYFTIEGELTLPTISGTGFSEGGFGGGVYFVAGYPLSPNFKVIGRLGAYAASVDVPSAGGRRIPMWGLVGFGVVYQGAPWAGR